MQAKYVRKGKVSAKNLRVSFCVSSLHTLSSVLSLSPPALLRQVQLVLGLSAGLLFMPAAIALFIPLCALTVALFITSKKCH